MSRILIAYATGEGQTDKVAVALSVQFIRAAQSVNLVNLGTVDVAPDPAQFDGVIVAASVHAGRHQPSALHFVRGHLPALENTFAAFLSISMSAAATTVAGQREADRQVDAFLKEADWRPALVVAVPGALHYSQLAWYKRLWVRLAQRAFRSQLRGLGWPDDLTRDVDFTDWAKVREFGEHFLALLAQRKARPTAA